MDPSPRFSLVSLTGPPPSLTSVPTPAVPNSKPGPGIQHQMASPEDTHTSKIIQIEQLEFIYLGIHIDITTI